MVVNFIYCKVIGTHFIEVPKEFRKTMLIRSLAGFIGTQAAWTATKYMPLSMSSAIISTYPTVLAVLAHFYLGEKISKFDVFAIFISLTGVLIINYGN